MNYQYKQVLAKQNNYKKKLRELFGTITEQSGIYILTREEDGFKYAYVGQAKHICTRLAQHCLGYQAIDLSIKKHGWYSADNPTGWKMEYRKYDEVQLNAKEVFWIREMADQGYQLRNCTSGSQGEGKRSLDNARPNKKYGDGLIQGRKNASREMAHLFDLHLVVDTKKHPPTVNQQKALDKFKAFLEFYKEEIDEDC